MDENTMTAIICVSFMALVAFIFFVMWRDI